MGFSNLAGSPSAWVNAALADRDLRDHRLPALAEATASPSRYYFSAWGTPPSPPSVACRSRAKATTPPTRPVLRAPSSPQAGIWR
jgi:hypothetical protein